MLVIAIVAPPLVVAEKPPRSESNAVALIGPSRSTRGVVVVQSMIVEASPAERPPSTTASTSAPSAALTAAAVSAVGSPWRLALVVASGPVRRSNSSTSGCAGHADAECRSVSRDRPPAASERADDRERARPVRGRQGPRCGAEVDVCLDVRQGRRKERQLEAVGTPFDRVDAARPRPCSPGRMRARRQCRWE